MKNNAVYIVNAYKWGARECHSYTVGVYTTKKKSLKAAVHEEKVRGGKYKCEVLPFRLDSLYESAPVAVKPLTQPSYSGMSTEEELL